MLLSNLSQQFVIYIGNNFFYPEITARWLPVIRKLSMPYLTVEDFMNAQIQSINFPALDMPEVTQKMGPYKISKKNGFNTGEKIMKDISLTIKLTESYISYFIIREQMNLFYEFAKNVKGLYWDPLTIDLLDDSGHAIISYQEVQITPVSQSELSLSYAARMGSYQTFTLRSKFNFLDIWFLDAQTGKREKISRI